MFLINAHLDSASRAQGRRHIYPHLSFHFDRGRNQPRHHSLFTRDPFDPEQSAPRRSSTVFIANIVARLQRQRELGGRPRDETGLHTPYEIFGSERMADVGGTWSRSRRRGGRRSPRSRRRWRS